MLSFHELNKQWGKAVRTHGITPLMGERGLYNPIGSKTLALLDPLWKENSTSVPNIGALLEAGKTIKFWADPHFDHDRIIEMCRPNDFSSVDNMNEVLWRTVLEEAKTCDLLVCVGDLALTGAISWQRKLNQALPNKHVIFVGNHDLKGSQPRDWVNSGAHASGAFSLSKALLQSWAKEDWPLEYDLVEWSRLPNHVYFGIAHWPIPVERMPSSAWISIHGHIHNGASKPLRINCSVEAIEYRPRSIRSMIDAMLLSDLEVRQSNPHAFVEAMAVRDPDL